LPTERTIRNKLSDLGIRPQRVKKCESKRKIPETDAIFKQVHLINAKADSDPNTLRLSMDCKATVNVGPFSRGGKNRVEQEASDHDFEPDEKLTPFGIYIPELCESHFSPVERVWGVLENHWCGELLTSTEKTLGLARAMTYRGKIPSTVRLIRRKIYQKGVRLTKKQMVSVERQLQRLKGLSKWFITILP
jgi:hypothetical protein